MREQQVVTTAAAIVETCPGIPVIAARAHAAAFVSVTRTSTDEIGARVLGAAPPDAATGNMTQVGDRAFDDLDQTFQDVTNTTAKGIIA